MILFRANLHYYLKKLLSFIAFAVTSWLSCLLPDSQPTTPIELAWLWGILTPLALVGLADDRCRIMALHGISRDAWKRYTAEVTWYYEIVAPGYKYNLTDIASGIGLAQLDKSDRHVTNDGGEFMKMTKISIITVVYNDRQTISSAIESILAQDHPNIEHIINNQSTQTKINPLPITQ